MKKNLLFIIVLLAVVCANAQVRPSIMIVPSDQWCELRNFMKSYSDNGTTYYVPDYEEAFRQDMELSPMINTLKGMFLDYCYKDVMSCEQAIKNLNRSESADAITYSKTNGAQFRETELDIIKRQLKSDIILYVNWIPNGIGGSQTLSMEAVDAYTGMSIAAVTCTNVSMNLSKLSHEIKQNFTSLDNQLVSYYELLESEGRSISLTIRCWDSWDKDLEYEFNGEELLDIIRTWCYKNTINGSFRMDDATENFAVFGSVQIPLIDESGMQMDARSFANMLRKYLRKNYEIPSKLMQNGLGSATLVLGEK